MPNQLQSKLKKPSETGSLPTIFAYNRIDGPGSSLDLREFQQAFWRLPEIPKNRTKDPSLKWTRDLPRTVGITIDCGTKIEAHPFKKGQISVKSIDYNQETIAKSGNVPMKKENWLLKIIDIMGLSGVKFVLKNLREKTVSSGLGGSATATTGVCILANELAGRPFDKIQLLAMASRLEQDMGVSLTGTQEQSNVCFGGVTDYIWFPWGIPGDKETSYGQSIRSELIAPKDYLELEKRMTIFHTGEVRQSTDVNSVWTKALTTTTGFNISKNQAEVAYQFREGLRLSNWDQVLESIRDYQKIRSEICTDYMNGAQEMNGVATGKGGAVFPLGAGGGGSVLIFSPDPDSLKSIKSALSKYTEIPVRINSKGHRMINLPTERK